MSPIRPVGFSDLIFLLVFLWLLLKFMRRLRRRETTLLRGPASKSWIFGISQFLGGLQDPAVVYEEWAEKYGAVFRIPIAMGANRIYILDPKAVAHVTSRDTSRYVHAALNRVFIENMAGRGIMWAEGESHKRQRKTLTSAFSVSAIRQLTHVFFDSAYKVKVAWDALLESSVDGEAIIDVQNWMNHVSLDSIGIAGFSHDFGTLSGQRSAVCDVFDSFGTLKPSLAQVLVVILGTAFPILARAPTKRRKLVKKFVSDADEISRELLRKTRVEKEGNVAEAMGDKSVIGHLIKAESDETAELRISEEEVMAQMKILIIAGYETTSSSLTWALIELAKNQSIQAKLRDELISQFGNSRDPTYDQLTSGLPYLDAVVHETLRLHAAVPEMGRVAAEDDVIPLSVPIQTADNQTVDHISISAGQLVSIPILAIQRCKSIWGEDAHEFKPERWLDEDGIPSKAKEFQGYHHLFTFGDGPRTCLGKGFATIEFKAALSVLIRNYVIELRDGPETKFELGRAILPRPRLVGEEGCCIPLRVRRLE
jgi:cytochrome P450